jgi:hypothetical protein
MLRWALTCGLGLLLAAEAEARTTNDCMSAWSRAVRSYLTTNRTAMPDGTVPEDLDGEERAAQAWMQAFLPACRMEEQGSEADARVEAAAIGVEILARLDPRGCRSFLGRFMESTRPDDICSAAGSDGVDLRSQIARTIPAR